MHALDDDPFAIETTVGNAKANDVTVAATAGDVTLFALPTVDVAVANIALETVERLAARVDAVDLVVWGTSSATPRALPAGCTSSGGLSTAGRLIAFAEVL